MDTLQEEVDDHMAVIADKFAIRRRFRHGRELLKKERTDELIIDWLTPTFARHDRLVGEPEPPVWKPFKVLPELTEKELRKDPLLRSSRRHG